MPEQEPPRRDEPQIEHKEGEPLPYYQAARYQIERPAKQAYSAAQALVASPEGTYLSAYRFYLPDEPRKPNVAVLGDSPAAEVHDQITQILKAGTPLTIPEPVLIMLFDRRTQAHQINEYVEGHHRPGRVFRTPRPEG